MQGVTEWGHDALNDEARDGLLVWLWLASPLTSSAIPPASGVMQGVTEWGHDALKYEAHGLPLCHGLACLSVMIWLASLSWSGLPLGFDLACFSADLFSNSTSQRGHAGRDGMGA